jgi:hypothetical protein
VVAPEDPAPTRPASAPPPRPAPAPAPDDDDEGDEDEGDAGASAQVDPGKPGTLSFRLTGLQVNAVSKPMLVAVWASGESRLASATVAIRFNERLVRVVKVESTGLFDGQLGAKLPFEVRNGVLFVTMARAPDAAETPINGQLMNITFEVLGSGSMSLAVLPKESRLVGRENVLAVARSEAPLLVTTR